MEWMERRAGWRLGQGRQARAVSSRGECLQGARAGRHLEQERRLPAGQGGVLKKGGVPSRCGPRAAPPLRSTTFGLRPKELDFWEPKTLD